MCLSKIKLMKKAVVLLFLALLFSMAANANGRNHIRQSIKSWGECRNVAITKYNGDLAIYGGNGVARFNIPEKLEEALVELNEKREFIQDVQQESRDFIYIVETK